MSTESREYLRGAQDASDYFFDLHTRMEKAAAAGADRILAKMREYPDANVYAYFTPAGDADSEVIAAVQGEPIPAGACLVVDEAIERVPREYLFGFLFQRLRALPVLGTDAPHPPGCAH